MSSWEERMALQSQAKGRTYRQELERGSQAADDEFDGEHAGHHSHLQGTAVYCSCGHFMGVTCVAFPPEWGSMTEEEVQAEIDALSCRICGERGLVALAAGDAGLAGGVERVANTTGSRSS